MHIRTPRALAGLAAAGTVVAMSIVGTAAPQNASPTAPAPSTPQSSTSAQAEQRPVFRSGASFVSVDVYPRRDGKVVEGLTADDFQVFEDGKPQKVEAFEFIRVPARDIEDPRRDPNTKDDGDRMAADPRNRVFVIYLDVYHTALVTSTQAQSPVLDFLNRSMGPADLFAVMTPDVQASQMTFARSTVTLEGELAAHSNWGEADQKFPKTPIEQQLSTCFRGMEDQTGLLLKLHREDKFYASLESLVTRLGDLREERKNIVLLTQGTWAPKVGGTILKTLGDGTAPAIGVQPGGRLGVGVDPSRQSGARDMSWCDGMITHLAAMDPDRRFKDLLKKAGAANVSFFPVDLGGLTVAPPTATLRELAENTDGLAILNRNDLAVGMRQITDRLATYYLLGYASTNTRLDGRYREIEVKVKQPKIDVAARRGYLAAKAPEVVAAPPTTVASPVLDALKRLGQIRSEASLVGYGVPGAAGLDVVAELSSRDVDSGRWKDGLDVRVVVTPQAGGEVTATGRIEAAARSVAIHVPLTAAQTAPWRVSLRTAGDIDGVDDRLDVAADVGRVLGAPLAFRALPSPRSPLRPVADFQFRRTERLHVEWPLLASAPDRAARLLDRRGQPLAAGLPVTERQVDGRVMVAVDLNLASFSEGEYLLDLTAGTGNDVERRLVAFRMVR